MTRCNRLSEAEQVWQYQPFDAVLLDLNLPDGNALTGCAAHALVATTPVLVLTARNRTDDASPASTLAPTTIWASRLTWLRLKPDCGRWCDVRRAEPTMSRSGACGSMALPHAYSLVTRHSTCQRARVRGALGVSHPPGRVVNKRALSDKLSGLEDSLGDNALEAFVLPSATQTGRYRRDHPHPSRTWLPARTGRYWRVNAVTATAPTLRQRLLSHVLLPVFVVWLTSTALIIEIAYVYTQRAFDRARSMMLTRLSAHVRQNRPD